MQQTKYLQWHDAIISRARHRTLDAYHESHHIRPRSLGGDDSPANLVDLTYREHFLVHWLLTKICEGAERRKMVMALHCMTWPLRFGRPVAGWRVEVSKRALRDEWMRRARERHAREIERQRSALAQLARLQANKLVIADWRKTHEPSITRGSAGRFEKASRHRKRPRAGRKARQATKKFLVG